MPGKPEHEVIGESKGESVFVKGHGHFQKYEVVGKITTHRFLLGGRVGYVRDMVRHLRGCKHTDLPRYLDLLDGEIDKLADDIERVLVESGDIDPRHTEET